MTGIILAGGQSLRLGRDKALEILGGKTLLERVVDSLAQVAKDILIVGALQKHPVTQFPSVRILEDTYSGRGPLGGLYTGLVAAASDYAWVVACDMPLLDAQLLQYLMELAPGYDAVVPRLDGKAQTLHAVYSRECIPVAEALLHKGKPGLHTLLDGVRVRYLEEVEMESPERWRCSCFNINTQADLDKAHRCL